MVSMGKGSHTPGWEPQIFPQRWVGERYHLAADNLVAVATTAPKPVPQGLCNAVAVLTQLLLALPSAGWEPHLPCLVQERLQRFRLLLPASHLARLLRRAQLALELVNPALVLAGSRITSLAALPRSSRTATRPFVSVPFGGRLP